MLLLLPVCFPACLPEAGGPSCLLTCHCLPTCYRYCLPTCYCLLTTAYCLPTCYCLQVLLPALQKLVDLPEWRQWRRSLLATFPFPQDRVDTFTQQFRWVGGDCVEACAEQFRWGGGVCVCGGGGDCVEACAERLGRNMWVDVLVVVGQTMLRHALSGPGVWVCMRGSKAMCM